MYLSTFLPVLLQLPDLSQILDITASPLVDDLANITNYEGKERPDGMTIICT
jgi:hypothetical protein